jgi:hypothetical protein
VDRRWVDVGQAKRADGGDLGDVLARLRPVEVGLAAGQDDDAAGRMRDELCLVEGLAKADVEDAGGCCQTNVDMSPVRRSSPKPMWG